MKRYNQKSGRRASTRWIRTERQWNDKALSQWLLDSRKEPYKVAQKLKYYY